MIPAFFSLVSWRRLEADGRVEKEKKRERDYTCRKRKGMKGMAICCAMVWKVLYLLRIYESEKWKGKGKVGSYSLSGWKRQTSSRYLFFFSLFEDSLFR